MASTVALISVCHSEDWKAHFAGCQMRRHEFITLLGGAAAAWPLAATAQQPAVPVVGFLVSGPAAQEVMSFRLAAFHQALNESG